MTIRVLIAEDQSMVRGALAALLQLEPDIVVAQASDGRDALALVEQLAPDVVLTDIEMPNLTGLELASAIAARGAGTRVAREAWTEKDPLTDRERQALRLAGEGLSSAAIARTLSLSEGTVRNYLSDVITKLKAANRTEAARIARDKAGCRKQWKGDFNSIR